MSRGSFVAQSDAHYRVGGNEVITWNDAGEEVRERIPVVADLQQPGWPAIQSALDFRQSVRQMYANIGLSSISGHVMISEVVRAVDCRLAELLFYVGRYPEHFWIAKGQQMSLSKKIKVAKSLFPRVAIPRTLMFHVAHVRNLAEHQYETPSAEDIHSAYEVMELFFLATQQFKDVLSNTSVFRYNTPLSKNPIVIQVLRERARLFVCIDGSPFAEDQTVETADPHGQRIVQKILTDVQWHLDMDPGFMTKMGFV